MEKNLKELEHLYKIIYDATKEKFSILPILAGLMVAIISLGLSGGLFEITNTIKLLSTILLLLMILSLQVYYSETVGLLTIATDRFDEILGKEKSNFSLTVSQSICYLITGKINGKKKEVDFFDRFSSQFSALALLVMWFVVFILILHIWR